MIRKICKDDIEIEYELILKNVKNINLRIKSDGKVTVSANKNVSLEFIDRFLKDKAEFIKTTIDKYQSMKSEPKKRYYKDDEIRELIEEFSKKVYPYFEKKGIEYPEIKFRKMKSQWGNCHPKKGILTFNTNLVFASYECIEYVVMHEFTHFLEPNHSKKFYEELEKICPDWKKRRNELKKIFI